MKDGIPQYKKTYVPLAQTETGAKTPPPATLLRATDLAGAPMDVKADAVAARDRAARESFIVYYCEEEAEAFA